MTSPPNRPRLPEPAKSGCDRRARPTHPVRPEHTENGAPPGGQVDPREREGLPESFDRSPGLEGEGHGVSSVEL